MRIVLCDLTWGSTVTSGLLVAAGAGLVVLAVQAILERERDKAAKAEKERQDQADKLEAAARDERTRIFDAAKEARAFAQAAHDKIAVVERDASSKLETHISDDGEKHAMERDDHSALRERVSVHDERIKQLEKP